MAVTITSLCERVTHSLWDSGQAIYPAAAIEEGIRQALGEYNFTVRGGGGTSAAILGLDGAQATSLPAEHENLIVLGAAGFAACGRALDRAEAYELNEEVPAVLAKWGEDQLGQFRRLLVSLRDDVDREIETARRSALWAGSHAPWGSAAWKLDEHDGEPL